MPKYGVPSPTASPTQGINALAGPLTVYAAKAMTDEEFKVRISRTRTRFVTRLEGEARIMAAPGIYRVRSLGNYGYALSRKGSATFLLSIDEFRYYERIKAIKVIRGKRRH